MRALIETPGRALLIGFGLTVFILLLWAVTAGVDPVGFGSYFLRYLHIVGAMLWVGLIYFVNFVQLAAVAEASPEGRQTLMKAVVPRVMSGIRHTSHLTLLSGVLLLVTSGYLLDRIVFTSEVYIPPLRNLLLWGGTLGGVAMWAFVHFRIWPAVRVVLGEVAGDEAAKTKARESVKIYARINLILALRVTAVMVAAAHLY
jgi:uncharacterized membrane protein